VGLLTAAFRPVPKANADVIGVEDFLYSADPASYISRAGGYGLSAESILNCGTVLAAVRFRGDSWAMCPPSTFRKTSKGREDMPTHYSQRILRNPTSWMTGNRWRHLNGVWMATWGNAYNEIRPGKDAFVGALWPMHPSRVSVTEQRGDGTLVYEYRRPGTHTPEKLGQEKVLHFRDLSTDGISGAEMYRLIRNVVNIALLAEQHAATFLRKGARIAGLLVPSAPLGLQERKDLRESVNADFGGASMTGTLGVLPHGIDLKPLSLSNRDNQIVEISEQAIGMILRFLGVPGVVVGYADKTATYASAEAFFEKGGIKHCVLPILVNAEAEEERALLLVDDELQIKHNLDALERASLAGRYEAYSKALGGAPFLSVNDVRLTEDWNEDPDPRHSEIRIPVNLMAPAAAVEESEPAPPLPFAPPPRPADGEEARLQQHVAKVGALARHWATETAARCVRRETATIAAKAPKLARDAAAWREFVLGFYESHVQYVAETMRISEDTARRYCERQAATLLHGPAGVAVTETWPERIPSQLADLALEDAC
jgi:HK97 family phage portal protein